jgi:hypothetical protein
MYTYTQTHRNKEAERERERERERGETQREKERDLHATDIKACASDEYSIVKMEPQWCIDVRLAL